jgi:phospholipase/lecithinase/hemolysin
VVSLAAACTPAAAAYTSIFVFGDSLSDAGNLFAKSGGKIRSRTTSAATSATARPGWKICPRCWALAMKPFLTSNDGTNYVVGGAQTGITDINPPNPSSPIHIDFPDQINVFNLVDPNPVKGALYTLDIGANDIMNALAEFVGGTISLTEVNTVVSQAETNTIHSVGALFGLGARSLLFYEVPNLGLTPRFDGTALQSLASDLAESFNVAVLKGLAPIESSGLKVFTLETYDLLGESKPIRPNLASRT